MRKRKTQHTKQWRRTNVDKRLAIRANSIRHKYRDSRVPHQVIYDEYVNYQKELGMRDC